MMKGWRVCRGGNQRDSEMNERPLKRRKGRGEKLADCSCSSGDLQRQQGL